MTTTTDLAMFGTREIAMVRDLLDSWMTQGLPSDFTQDAVVPMMNQNSGCVFLTNSEYEVAMINGDKLESFYTSPYEGKEGFFDDMVGEYEDMHHEDQEWMRDLAERLERSDELPEIADEEDSE